MSLATTFRALRHRNFRLFFGGQLVSLIGTWMQSVAQAWVILQLTGSGLALGLTTALQFGPILVLGPWGGVLADRCAELLQSIQSVRVGSRPTWAALKPSARLRKAPIPLSGLRSMRDRI